MIYRQTTTTWKPRESNERKHIISQRFLFHNVVYFHCQRLNLFAVCMVSPIKCICIVFSVIPYLRLSLVFSNFSHDVIKHDFMSSNIMINGWLTLKITFSPSFSAWWSFGRNSMIKEKFENTKETLPRKIFKFDQFIHENLDK
jgi:hypothetical protein